MKVMQVTCDNGNVNANTSNANFPNVGGNYSNTAGNAGMFNCNVNNNSTNSNSNIAARIPFLHSTALFGGGDLHDRGSCQNTTAFPNALVLPRGDKGHRKMRATNERIICAV